MKKKRTDLFEENKQQPKIKHTPVRIPTSSIDAIFSAANYYPKRRSFNLSLDLSNPKIAAY
ncbi:hypothetical protein [Paenibacillus alginolyticus]|uniref:Uncharacterized protein n=1 Tax=Paenibacillus alginolyticus TaxID=59839 RepID=A0ABT4GDN8_9BACL|nr:hypothetical protein [Paenibacillus alginolyticus]MCY9694224.1 hypothetical protein [Paenibacillus alginolyticus]MEC0142774.1 hypothetical protein [Paenibacillus alginolyticus]